jgi:hypothetical protein
LAAAKEEEEEEEVATEEGVEATSDATLSRGFAS